MDDHRVRALTDMTAKGPDFGIAINGMNVLLAANWIMTFLLRDRGGLFQRLMCL
jgi:hypothetical protein